MDGDQYREEAEGAVQRIEKALTRIAAVAEQQYMSPAEMAEHASSSSRNVSSADKAAIAALIEMHEKLRDNVAEQIDALDALLAELRP